MKIYFLGTNGWYDSPAGNTVCTLIDAKEAYVIFDAGFGLAKAHKFLREKKPVYIFFSHFHLDHTCGLHALETLGRELTIFGPRGLKKMFATLIQHPYAMAMQEFSFPVSLIETKAGNYKWPFAFMARDLHHIDGCLGYRLTLEGKTVAYCSDTAPCAGDKELARGADLLIHECALLPNRTNTIWGHTNPEAVAALAKEVKPKKVYLTHFAGNNYFSLADRKKKIAKAQKIFPIKASYDSLVIEV